MSKRNFLKLVDKANKTLNPLEEIIAKTKLVSSNDPDRLTFICYKRSSLPDSLFSWIIDLIERNMSHFYETSSWGWNKKDKLKEIDYAEAYFLVLYKKDHEKSPNQSVGFSHFRFDIDYGRPVLYCYELQLDESFQRCGYGSKFVDILMEIAKYYKMHKCVVTVLKCNEPSLKFFYRNGFSRDDTCPEDSENVDYLILSKIVL